MTDQRIYTFPRLLHIAYILCKVIVIKSSFTNSRKVQYFISINILLISISGKEKLILYPYRFSNPLVMHDFDSLILCLDNVARVY